MELPASASVRTAGELDIVLQDDEEGRSRTDADATERPPPSVPPVLLALSAASHELRLMLGETLVEPLTSRGHRVMLLQTDPREGDAAVFEQALGLDVPLLRRSLGDTRDILLMEAAKRRSLFARLADDERRSELVVIDLDLPESILCPRLQFLVDTVVVGVTVRDSSLYEAYRALRGLAEKRPGLVPFVVPIVRSAEEAEILLDRFRKISSDFLKLAVVEGGWVQRPAIGGDAGDSRDSSARVRGEATWSAIPKPPGGGNRDDRGSIADRNPSGGAAAPRRMTPTPGLSPSLLRALEQTSPAEPGRGMMLRERSRSFFENLSDWFGPVLS